MLQNRFKSVIEPIIILLILMTFMGCRTIPVLEREPIRLRINDQAVDTISQIVKEKPAIQEEIAKSAGYFTGRVKSVKAPVIGGGVGSGILYDKIQNTRTYMDILRMDIGLGLSAGAYRVLILLPDQDALNAFKKGTTRTGITAETAVGETLATTISEFQKNVPVYILGESGVAATAGARVVRLSVNEDLTDTGVSNISLPNTNFKRIDSQGEDAPKVWTHKMPFLAQKVIDKGYDLPLPYGIGLTFAYVSQDMFLDALEVGFNGGAKEPFEFVGFNNASSKNSTLQLKVDSWIFPFMNVYATLGRIDGSATMDVLLDGNGMLSHMDISCSGFPPNPLCPLLKDKTFTLPIDTDFSGTNFGVGTVLAGGWNNWFVTIPLNFSFADMDSTDTEGIAYTITPRVGRTLNLEKWGNLSLFTGGNYLITDLTISGTYSVPGYNFDIDYTIDQENADPWNIVLGGNWDINKRWSVSAEYNGLIGSRDAFIMSLTTRF